jgi:hypothetical protein
MKKVQKRLSGTNSKNKDKIHVTYKLVSIKTFLFELQERQDNFIRIIIYKL